MCRAPVNLLAATVAIGFVALVVAVDFGISDILRL